MIVFSAIILVVLTVACLIIHAREEGYVFFGRTLGGWTSIHDDTRVVGQRVRVLEVAGTYQSATYLDDRWTLPVFRYHWLFDHAFDAWPDGDGPRTVAVLGGGGYAIPKYLVAQHHEVTRIDVVELDPAIERLARKHFFLNRLEERFHAEAEGRLRLHIADASAWLASTNERYDAIINDCFLALNPDEPLMSSEAATLLHDHLTPQGLYLTNVVSALEGADAMVLYRVIASLEQVFSHIWVYPCSPNTPSLRDNNIVIATNAPHYFDGAWEWPSSDGEE